MYRRLRSLLGLCLLAGTLCSSVSRAEPSAEQMVEMLRTLDDRTQNPGDYRSSVFIEQKKKGQSDLVYQVEVYRRDLDDKLLLLFSKPRAEAGKGYLRIDDNLFFYDPTVGKWERRTERERIGGTDSNRNDFDQSRLAEEYDPSYLGEEALGRFTVHHLKLEAKPEADVGYPVVELWLDSDTGNTLKRQERAISGRLMRTTYYPSWQKLFSPSKGADVYFAKEIRIFDELQEGSTTTVVIQSVDLEALEPSLFTKAWLESKSR
ncbi:MAG: outer membrane lipoprotein-sorting protein [Myxococcota bacterium]|jgi:hypothetical protein|nr:outer membrane lipoprotein-sorting protein [Myxococcota bacterium]